MPHIVVLNGGYPDLLSSHMHSYIQYTIFVFRHKSAHKMDAEMSS